MEQLETTKGKSITVPRLVKRYILMMWHEGLGWQCNMNVYTTPESAIENFIEQQNRYFNKDIKYYKCIEVELEVPFVPKTD
jgi:hypothetical protein